MPFDKPIDLRAFMDEGYLQEVNRRFFHPLGLAMFISFDDDGVATHCGVYDDRDDPEGCSFNFANWPDREKAVARFHGNVAKVDEEWRIHEEIRQRNLGYMVQPPEFIIPPGA